MNLRLVQLCLLLASPLTLPAAVSEPGIILIRDISLVDPSGDAADRTVNILIRDAKLKLISEDSITAKHKAHTDVDAQGGFVVGRLEVGSSPNFVILNADPRTNFEVMLDTKSYTTFAVHEGRVVKNLLPRTVGADDDTEPGSSGWLAYTPPPLALPLDYRNSRKWNMFQTKWVSGLFTGAIALDRMNWLSQNSGSESVFGNLNEFDGGEIRALRFGLVGTLNFARPWVYTIAGATNSFDKGFETENQDDVTLFDWRLDIPFFKNSTLSIGKQKEPISMERLTGMVFLPWQERSVAADGLLPARNVGVVWSGYNPTHRASWAFGLFNDWLDADQDIDESSTQFAGRVTWAPFHSMDESNLLHLGVGYRYSDAKEGFRFHTEPEFNKSPTFVDTAFGSESLLRSADDFQTYNIELSWRKGPFWLASELFRTDVSNRDLEHPSFDGYYVSASWILTGEMRAYNPKNGLFRSVPVAQSAYQGGMGAVEVALRYTGLDLDDGAVPGGNVEAASLGLNWWLTPFFSLGANYRYVWNELDDIDGNSGGFMTRILLILE
jgi:phosphate-selective porin OprO/OprP